MRLLTRLGMMFFIPHLLALTQPVENSSPPLLVANDNRTPAGQFTNGILNLQLELNGSQHAAFPG